VVLKEFFAKLGLDVDATSFATGQLAVDGVRFALGTLAKAASFVSHEFVSMFSETVEAADHLDETSQSTGVATDVLQELGYAASFSGMNVDSISFALMKLTRNMNAAKDGGGEAGDAFKKLGISVKEADGKLRSSDAVMLDIADKLADMPDGAEKTALAIQLFGRSGAGMIPFLNEGKDGLEEFKQEAIDLGIVLDGSTIKKGAAVDDSMTQLRGAFVGLRNIVAGPFLESINNVIQGFVRWVKENRELIKQRINKIISAVGTAFKLLWVVLKPLLKILGLLVDHLGLVAAIAGGMLVASLYASASAAAAASGGFVAMGLSAVASGLAAAAAWALAALPVFVLGAVLALVILIAEDLWKAMNGGNSLIEKLWNKWSGFIDDWLKPKGDEPWWLVAIKVFLGMIWDIGGAWDDAVAFWREVFEDFFGWVEKKINWVSDKLESIGDFLGFGKETNNLVGGMNGIGVQMAQAAKIRDAGGSSGLSEAVARGQMPFDVAMRHIQAKQQIIQNHVKIEVAQQPGQDAGQLADHITRKMQEFHDAKLREADAVVQ
jgi:hypothetical protein